MPESNTPVRSTKHIRSFWPLVIIFTIAAILGGFIYFYQVNFSTDYDLQLMEISVNRRSESKAPVKSVTPRTTNN